MKIKTKKRICGLVLGICCLSTLGVCGSLEQKTIEPAYGDFFLYSFVAVGTFAGYKGGYIEFGARYKKVE